MKYIHNLIEERRAVYATDSTSLLEENDVLGLMMQASESEGKFGMSSEELVSTFTVLFRLQCISSPITEPTLAMSGWEHASASYCRPW